MLLSYIVFAHFLIFSGFTPPSLSSLVNRPLPNILFVTPQVHKLCSKQPCKQVISNFPFRVNSFALKMDHH
jgi:hypothetical protein